MRTTKLALLVFILALASQCLAAELEWIRVANDNRSFVMEKSGRKFVPWGFNYDHQEDSGRLIEEYWNDEWATVIEDFAEMKQLGANVIRIHLQFAAFMESADKPNNDSLDQFERLIKLAETTGLYLDLTGLGCYHKKDVPAWYDKLSESQRWNAQCVFWESVAERCANSPAIFCYDLMNEPVVPGNDERDDWLGAGFGGKHFVQFITRSAGGRPRHEIAKRWINQLTAAIRKHDQNHLITVGLVHWSLDRPGLTSGFVPDKVTEQLDFIAVHLYPESDKLDEATATLKGFASVGKPVVIEEVFPLKCSTEELSHFIGEAKKYAAGWIGFYWGKTPDEYRELKTLRSAIVLSWLELFEHETNQWQSRFASAQCEGTYQHHLQGICTNGKNEIYWSFTTTLVKTDLNGSVLKKIPVANHHGDLCYQDGKLYVAVNLGKFNDPNGNADSWVYVYDAKSLEHLASYETQKVYHGAGGIGHRDDRFFVVGGLPANIQENYVYEYDADFQFVKKHVIKSGHTYLGIQTATFAHDRWWFGCYGDPKILLVTDADFNLIGRHEIDCSLGIEGLSDGRLLVANGRCDKDKGCRGALNLATPDRRIGFKVQND
ncbi:glycoside hydrolase family 5 protein [Stieleria sp. JC731]|uniref:cellulase family glycosylhydrolase n=1 Tax=Pirellulaceae TaxID=2691357 RepID=UPI001E51BDC3|nr:cellulase family glycosylhydrolase [Stieleria sp. JC731]MCC9602169.1 glycoside hydrolase family 5 protein [Stieleria sp. JC731]